MFRHQKAQNTSALPMVLERLLLLLILLSAACLPLQPTFADHSAELDKVVLQLRWDPQFQFSGYYQALWQGYYEAAGLEVEIRHGFDENRQVLRPTEEVKDGRADFGIGTSDILLDMGASQLKIVASFFQKSPTEFYMLEEMPFEDLSDFNTLNVARRRDDTLDIELQAMLVSRGIMPNDDQLSDASMSIAFQDLLTGRFDVIPSYLGTMGYYAAKEGVGVRVIRPIDYGIDFYGDSLFTSARLATENPELVERFRSATIKGWEYALQFPVETSIAISSELPRVDMSLQEHTGYNRFQASVVQELMLYPVVAVGNLNPLRWDHMQQTLKELGFMAETYPIESILFDYDAIQEAKRIEAAEKRQGQIVSFVILLVVLFVLFLFVRNRELNDEIQERMKAEATLSRSYARHQSIFDNAVLAITMADENGIILQANGTWARQLGYPLEELIGMNILDLIAPSSRDQGKAELAALLEGRQEEIEFERTYIRKDGGLLYARVFMTRIKDPETDDMVNLAMIEDITRDFLEEEAVRRSEARFRAIVDDIAAEIGPEALRPLNAVALDATGRDRLSQKLEQINLELERLFKKELDENRQKEALIAHQGRLAATGEMVANIAHQWRQPLNNLALILSNLEDGYQYGDLQPDEFTKSIEKSKRLIKKMSETIDDFRDFLKPDSTPVVFSPLEEIETVLDLLEENLRFNKVKAAIHPNAAFRLSGSRQGFSQVLFNLVTNAIDAMSMAGVPMDRRFIDIELNAPEDCSCLEEGSTPLLEAPVLQEADACCEIVVRDSGPGVPESIREDVFNVYFTTKTGGKGTGLGLYIAKSIIENQFGGQLVLLDSQAGGASFAIRIPVKAMVSGDQRSAPTGAGTEEDAKLKELGGSRPLAQNYFMR
ncbi:ABC transporter substrate-binding protein [Acidaminobacter hydrogenoformans]|uniref:histidine kinase n=1 Tax=Acidaminobacter hydrogenoformans DSM 2784 TaxID=1120920 RepID=A0A1G5RZ87_9FIRM|nr:ABC transporter substrate-binding protein [Acidaminobacter hydrogenoformans]SCZ79070.1 PAS domain S-box-containing protein [Acidaminobacter hydrogenoformans DSM 2784]